ncbi:MAG TPA: SCO family protein [Tepidisphaeraceae bacterium]|nr:SCO family protein [Tepidisphaeraceae bacterium]
MFDRLKHLLGVTVLAAGLAAQADAPPTPAEQRGPAQPVQRDPGSILIGPGRMEPVPDELKNVTVDEKLAAELPLDAPFTDDAGNRVTLRKYFDGGKPVILQLGYYGCPMLCDLVSQGTVNALRDVSLEAGKDYDVVFVSVDPAETRELAYLKKTNFLRAYGRGGPEGWHFLVGREAPINEVAKAVGFQFKWVPSAGQFSHPAAIVLCTPDGKVSRYLYGVKFDPQVLQQALTDARAKKIVETVERFVMTCLQYDGRQGKHSSAALWMVRIGGILTVVALGMTLWVLFGRERARLARETVTPGGDGPAPPDART